MPKTELPDEYLKGLEENHRKKIEDLLDPAERLLMYSGARLNWIGEYINDENIHWTLETVPLDDLTLTGTNPGWNAITLTQAEASPAKLRELLKDPKIAEVFKDAEYVEIPILVRREEDKLQLLDGMNRTIAAIRDAKEDIRAYIGTRVGEPAPTIEPHVIYDFIKAYHQRGGNEEDFKAGLRFLVKAYSNARDLIENRFSHEWVPDDKIQQLLKEVLDEDKDA